MTSLCPHSSDKVHIRVRHDTGFTHLPSHSISVMELKHSAVTPHQTDECNLNVGTNKWGCRRQRGGRRGQDHRRSSLLTCVIGVFTFTQTHTHTYSHIHIHAASTSHSFSRSHIYKGTSKTGGQSSLVGRCIIGIGTCGGVMFLRLS